MLRGTTFKKGGIHPLDKKSLSKDKKIETLPTPETLTVSLSQHIGAPASLVVNKGDRVRMGDLLASPSSFVSAAVHAPRSGIVKDIVKTTLMGGQTVDAVLLECDSEESVKFDTKYEWSSLSKDELLNIVKESGIVGLGGAQFPASVKFATGDRKVEWLVINAVECEPYLTCDYRLMLERSENLLEGVKILSKILSPGKIVFAVEENKEDAALLIEEKAKKMGVDLTVTLLKMKYPQGDEKQLLQAITGKEIPSGKLPLDIGAIVSSLSSVNAIYEAVVYHKPLIERVVTVSGECVKEPKNLIVPFGTSFRTLLDYCGGSTEDANEFVAGGPMMGFDLPSLDMVTIKGNNGFLVLRSEKKKHTFPCMHCGKCAQHCPMKLTPNNMYRYITHGMYKEAMDIGLMDCKECGCCAYSCPSGLDLVQVFKLGKKMGRNIK